MSQKDINSRKYIRLNSCFPVEFSLYFSAEKAFSREYQGFTCNLSEGGICLEAKNLNPDDSELILNKKPRLSLTIYIPLKKDPVKATAEIMWVKKDGKSPAKNSCLIGLSYLDISLKDKNRILNYTRRLKYIPRITTILLLIMLIGISALFFYHVREREKNKALVHKLVSVSEVKGDIEKKILKIALDAFQQDSIALKGRIEFTQAGEVLLEEQLAQIRLKSGEIAQASIDKMLKWLKAHQTKRTGLVLSYEGDRQLKDWGFTYDQALACQAFLILGERNRSESILEFFLKDAQRSKGLLYNVYDVKTGMPCEYTIHSGPNIWIAIAACQYTLKTRSERFLSLAKEIALEMIALQNSSSDGSIKGGPGLEWVGTEHNLDAYALFDMLYDLTKEEVYKEAALVALDWLENVGYDKQEDRFLRGRGDATIATDTFSWAIAAIGPAKLVANDMDPDGIMEFAEKECRVEVKFHRPEGRTVDVTGFDFAKAQNIGRKGIISTEWTAQMIVAFRVMAEYYKGKGNLEKERIYKFKAEYYLSQLGKMVVSSPSPTGQGEGCLPYASMDNIETGHGWRVAEGRRTGSVAATAYYIFAYEDYNPLAFEARS